MHFASFLSGGFITDIVVNPPKGKQAKHTSVQCHGVTTVQKRNLSESLTKFEFESTIFFNCLKRKQSIWLQYKFASTQLNYFLEVRGNELITQILFCQQEIGPLDYCKVTSSRLSRIVAHPRIFKVLMKGNFGAYVL